MRARGHNTTALETAPPLVATRIPEAGIYIELGSAVVFLRAIAEAYEQEQNPSASMSLTWVADSWQATIDATNELEPTDLAVSTEEPLEITEVPPLGPASPAGQGDGPVR